MSYAYERQRAYLERSTQQGIKRIGLQVPEEAVADVRRFAEAARAALRNGDPVPSLEIVERNGSSSAA